MSTAYCFDLDGTITKEEILPALSREVDMFDEISALTEATIRGVIPFRKSFLLRCRLLKDIPLSRAQDVIAGIPLHDSLVSFIQQNRARCCVITGNLDAWVEPIKERLGCRFFTSLADTKDGHLLSVRDVINKADAVQTLRADYKRIIAIGDGMGDVPMFEQADVRIAFGGVHAPIQTLIQLSDFITYDEHALCRLLNTL